MNKNILAGVIVVVILAVGGIIYYSKGSSTQKAASLPIEQVSGVELQRPLVVGLVSWPGYAGGIVANNGFEPATESLFYKKYGLQVKFVLIEDIDARGKAFVRGGPDGVDVVWSTVDFWSNESPNYINSGMDARAIMQVDWSRGGDALVVREGIKSIEDLKGKTISLVQYTPSHWLLESLLQKSSLSEEDKESVRAKLIFSQDTMTARAAFAAGQADATVVWEPDVSTALVRPGSSILASSKENPELIADVMVAKENFIEQNPKTLEAFMRGWFDGVALAEQNLDATASLLMNNEPLFNELGFEKTKQSLSWVKWTALDDNIRMFGLDGSPALFDTLFTNSAQLWKKLGLIDAAIDPASVKNDRFLRAVYGK